jgi:hypothetical protein
MCLYDHLEIISVVNRQVNAAAKGSANVGRVDSAESRICIFFTRCCPQSSRFQIGIGVSPQMTYPSPSKALTKMHSADLPSTFSSPRERRCAGPSKVAALGMCPTMPTKPATLLASWMALRTFSDIRSVYDAKW